LTRNRRLFQSVPWMGPIAAWSTVFIVLAARAAGAQTDPTFDVQNYRPGPSPLDLLGVERGETPGHLGFGVQLAFDYSHDPLVISERTDGKWKVSSRLIEHRLEAHLAGVIGVLRFLQLGLGIPAVLYQSGESAPDPAVGLDAVEAAAFGDIDLCAKAALPWRLKDIVGLGLSFTLGVPSGGKKRFAGDGGVTAAPSLILDLDFKVVSFVVNVGYRYRDGGKILDLEVGQEIFAAAALGVTIKSFTVMGQMMWRGSPAHAGDENHNPVELTGGLRYLLKGHWAFAVGAGSSVTEGYGAPDLRVLASVGYVSRPAAKPGDRDGDGIPDDVDNCPDKAEDKDGFQDADGCPDKDHDGDGIPDKKDKCPEEPEDKDGFEDTDGCEDRDNDGDTIPDIHDECPDQPESDNDVEDGDGCPEPDSDSDGIVDVADQCPDKPEDGDGFEDQDGCPEIDNDGDGILDADDGCPIEPETLNGVEDEDGCPDKARILGCQITIKEKVQFKSGSAKLLPASYDLLDEVAGILKANPQLGLIRIEGHTDDKGSDELNLKLSQERAESVLAYLVEKGVEESRLKAVGFGEGKPIADNATAEGRGKNRRVEFHIEACEEKTEAVK
jgi:outer membrane protein OmpA-like peptidoglycan-associated protein